MDGLLSNWAGLRISRAPALEAFVSLGALRWAPYTENRGNTHFIPVSIVLDLDHGQRNLKYKYVSAYLGNYPNPNSLMRWWASQCLEPCCSTWQLPASDGF